MVKSTTPERERKGVERERDGERERERGLLPIMPYMDTYMRLE